MLHKRHNSVVTLFILLTFVGVSKPAKAFLLAQSETVAKTFSLPDELPQDVEVDDSGLANLDVEDSVEINPDVEDSGEINPDVEDSGGINPDVEDSGGINPDVEGTGEINPDVETSGEVNPDFEDSGEINPNIETSGEPLSLENPKIDGATTPEILIADEDVTTPNTSEGETSGVETTAKKGGWWWLALILGIPLLVLVAIFAFGGRKKSDQEPAISNIPNPDVSNGGIGIPGGADGADISALGTNMSGNLSNITENAVGTTSRLGNAAIANGGAAPANLVGGNQRAENETNIDIDLDEPESVNEIPSNSVTEFTDQETKLQTDISSGFTNDISASANALGAAIGGLAADSGSLNNPEISPDEVTADSVIEDYSTADIELDTNVSELQTDQTTDLVDRGIDGVTDSGEAIELDQSSEAEVGTEFSGDFVLQEETKSTLPSDQDIAIDVTEVTPDINLDLRETAEGISGTVTDTVGEITTPELDQPNVEIDGDTDLGIVDPTTQAGGAAALGGAAAVASGFLNRNQDNEQPVDAEFTSDQDIAIDVTEVTPDINLDLRETAEGISGTVTDTVGEITTPELDRPNVEIDGDTDLGIVDPTTQAGGAAALGGAAAVASGFLNRNQDNEQPVDAQSTSEADDFDISLETSSTDVDNSLEGITLDNEQPVDAQSTSEADDFDISLETSSTDVDNSLEGITLDEAANMPELSLDEITFDDTETNSTSNLSNDLDLSNSSQNISLDDLAFEESESTDSLTSDLLSNNTAEITSLSDDQSNDMENISEWLDSLETPHQSTDNISEWLDTLKTDNADLVEEERKQDETTDYTQEADDISFKFLEDLLERDSNPNQDNK